MQNRRHEPPVFICSRHEMDVHTSRIEIQARQRHRFAAIGVTQAAIGNVADLQTDMPSFNQTY
jgi:hypothetical protein